MDGQKNENAKLPDAFLLTRVLQDVDLNTLTFRDLTGKPTALGDPRFAGRARIIEIFGSWCPNCHDAADWLSTLQNKYGDRGLSILGIAFEHSGDLERDARQVRRYMKKHGATWPVLLGGVSDKETATQQFQLLDRIRSYPTTIFLHSDGRVRAVHTGFSGPATGAAWTELQQRFTEIIEELLAEDESPPTA